MHVSVAVDSDQTGVHHEPVAVGLTVLQIRARAGKKVEIRLFRGPEDSNEWDVLTVVSPDPDDGKAQPRSTYGGDADGIAQFQPAQSPERCRLPSGSIQVPRYHRVADRSRRRTAPEPAGIRHELRHRHGAIRQEAHA